MTIPTGSRVLIIDAAGTAEPYATRLIGLTGVLDRVEGTFFYVRRRAGEVGFGNDCPMAGTWRVSGVVPVLDAREDWDADQKAYQWRGDGTDTTAMLSADVIVCINVEHLRDLTKGHRERGQREGRRRLAVEVDALVPVLTTAGEEALDILLQDAIVMKETTQ